MGAPNTGVDVVLLCAHAVAYCGASRRAPASFCHARRHKEGIAYEPPIYRLVPLHACFADMVVAGCGSTARTTVGDDTPRLAVTSGLGGEYGSGPTAAPDGEGPPEHCRPLIRLCVACLRWSGWPA